jgi:hypothetical protein
MPASSRCSGVNLYNHNKQVGKPQELSCSYVQLKDCEIWLKVDRGVLREFGYHRFKDNVWSKESLECLSNKQAWVCELTIDGEVRRECRYNKKEAFVSLLDSMESKLRSYL